MSKYLKDNFSVSKSGIPFTSIGSDQVSGGVIGLTQKPLALNRFCLTAPILNATSNKYCKRYDTWQCSKRKSHYQLTGSHLNRLFENVNKLIAEMHNYDVAFCNNDAVSHVCQKRCYQKIVQKSYCNTKP